MFSVGRVFSILVALGGGSHLFSWVCSTVVVRSSSQVTSGVSSLFVAEELLSRHNVPEGSTQVLSGESSLILAGPSSVFIAWGFFLVMA